MAAVRRLLRIAFNAVTVLSLGLAVLVAGLWVRSYWRLDRLRKASSDSFRGFDSEAGVITAFIDREVNRSWPRDRTWYSESGQRVQSPKLFRYYSASFPGVSFRLLSFPHAFAIAILLIPQTVTVIRLRRRYRIIAASLCPACGYDLRATPDRCPECGASTTGDEQQ
jgi:hypothetical protein